MIESHNSKLDKWGIFWSVACAIHCMALPLLVFSSPGLANAFTHEVVHWVLFVIVFPVAIFALWKPRKIHKSNIPVILGSMGILLLLTSLLMDGLVHAHDHATTYHGSLVTISGSLFLIAAHILNIKLHKMCCEREHAQKHDHHSCSSHHHDDHHQH